MATRFTTVGYHRVLCLNFFFFKFLRRKPWTCCVLIQNCLDLLHFGLNVKLWSPIAHAHKFFSPLLLYTVRYVSEFSIRCILNSVLIFFGLVAVCYPAPSSSCNFVYTLTFSGTTMSEEVSFPPCAPVHTLFCIISTSPREIFGVFLYPSITKELQGLQGNVKSSPPLPLPRWVNPN